MARLALVIVAASALLAGPGMTGLDAAPSGYGWPVKPFGAAHPVRSNFGDPRTLFRGPPTRASLYEGSGSFSLHNGVDIAASDGAPVYPVRSGTVTRNTAAKVFVHADSGDVFQYWHIVPSVTVGQRVIAYETVIGHIRKEYGHVHFVHIDGGRPVNPLSPGHLTPYTDDTAPQIDRVELRRPGTVNDLMPELIRGTVEIDAVAFDTPKPSAPGDWASMPTAPAELTWKVEQASNHKTRLREHTSFDTRLRLPAHRAFWSVYARGTRQNMPTFRRHRYWRDTGVFVFRLGAIDTHDLRDGIYTVVVTARDIAGNSATRSLTFLVYNHRRWPPDTNQA